MPRKSSEHNTILLKNSKRWKRRQSGRVLPAPGLPPGQCWHSSGDSTWFTEHSQQVLCSLGPQLPCARPVQVVFPPRASLLPRAGDPPQGLARSTEGGPPEVGLLGGIAK